LFDSLTFCKPCGYSYYSYISLFATGAATTADRQTYKHSQKTQLENKIE